MNKIIAILLIVCIAVGCATLLCACKPSESDDTFTVVTTIFPLYDWVKTIGGDHIKVVLLVDNGVDLHSFQPTIKDIATIAKADIFVYVGGESDGWVHDAVATTSNKDLVTVNLLDCLGDKAKVEEEIEGAEEEHDHDHDHEDEEEEEYDEHIWLSLSNAHYLVDVLAQKLAQADPDHAQDYLANAQTYGAALDVLNEQYKAAVRQATYHTLLFADRFPFRYLADDYGLDYYAAFSGCSAESEASFATITFLAGKLDELGLPVILTLEGSDGRIANTVKQSSSAKNQTILAIDSLQSTTIDQANAGKTYLGAMQSNLEVLKRAL